MRLSISQTPSNTASNTPTNTNSGSPCPTFTATPTLTPSPTFCANPKAVVLFDSTSGRTSLSAWMLSQGSTFRGLFINSPSVVQSTFQAQMNAYISYSGWGVTTYSLIQSGITYNQDPIQIINADNQWTGDFTWVSFFVPICSHCPGYYELIGDYSPSFTTSSFWYSRPFYYSGTSIPQGDYTWYTTYSNTQMRQSSYSSEYNLGNLICTGITPTPTITRTQTSTPSQTTTQTQTPSVTPTTTSTCSNYTIEGAPSIDVEWVDCDGTPNSASVTTAILICAQTGSVYQTGGAGNITQLGSCSSITPTQTSTPTITPTQTNTGTLTNTPTNTATQTNTPTPSVTIGLTPTVTPTNTETPTQTPSITPTNATAGLDITNGSLDIQIISVSVNSVGTTVIGGSLPNTTGNGTNLSTTQIGTYTIDVNYSCSVAGQKITLTDSDLFSTCINTSTGSNTATFTTQVVANYHNVLIDAQDGTC
jgi:hypothetical protein